MASFYGDSDILAGLVHGFLLPADGRSGFEGGPEDKIASVADAAQNPAGMIGLFSDGSVFFPVKCVVIAAAAYFGSGKTVSDLEALDSADGADGFCQTGIQFFKAGLPDAGGHALNDAFYDAAAGILLCPAGIQMRFGQCGSGGIGHIDGILLHLRQIKPAVINGYRANGLRICSNCNAQFGQDLCSYGSGGYAADGLSAGRTAASCVVPESVFAVIGIICMPGTVTGGDFAVISGALGGVADHQGNGGTGGSSLKDAG